MMNAQKNQDVIEKKTKKTLYFTQNNTKRQCSSFWSRYYSDALSCSWDKKFAVLTTQSLKTMETWRQNSFFYDFTVYLGLYQKGAHMSRPHCSLPTPELDGFEADNPNLDSVLIIQD